MSKVFNTVVVYICLLKLKIHIVKSLNRNWVTYMFALPKLNFMQMKHYKMFSC